MNKIQAERLLTLAWFLRTEVDPSKFNMYVYANGFKLHACNTSGCALGWATVCFPNLLRIGKKFDEPAIAPPRMRSVNFYSPYIQNLFGLTEKECHTAFSFIHKRTPKQEAVVLERLAKKHEWEYAAPLEKKRSYAK